MFAFIAVSFSLVLPLRWLEPPVTAFMLQDDSGRVPVHYDWSAWEALGSAAPLAAVAAEDQRFADHFGLDFESISRSLQQAEQGGRPRGASTISQQVVKNLYLWPGRSYIRKGIEAYLTLVAELCLPKRRILELYLNIAELGPGVYGFPAASRHYFGKAAQELGYAEAALLAAVLPNPHLLQADRPTGYVRERQRWIIGQMRRLDREGWLTRIQSAVPGSG